MKNESKKSFIDWVKAHKKELIIAGVSTTAMIVLVLCYRNRKQIMALWATLQGAIAKTPEVAPVASDVVEKVVEEVAPVVEVVEPVKLIVVDASNIDQLPFEVSKHIRNLPEGWHPSAEKIATAAENGIHLLPNQTWVTDYMKGGVAA